MITCKTSILVGKDGTKQQSMLYQSLIDHFNGREEFVEIIDELFAQVQTDQFKMQFGDWTKGDFTLDKTGDSLNAAGEPKLHVDKDGFLYFQPLSTGSLKSRILINGAESFFTAEEAMDITKEIAYLAFKKIKEAYGNAGSKDARSILNWLEGRGGTSTIFQDAFNDYANEIRNTLMMLEGKEKEEYLKIAVHFASSKDHFQSLLRDYFKEFLGVETTIYPVEESSDGEISEDSHGESAGDGVGFGRESYKINPRDRASVNTKLLIAFLPSYIRDADGKFQKEINSSKLSRKFATPTLKFSEYSDNWSQLINALEGMDIIMDEHGNVQDLKNIVYSKLHELAAKKPQFLGLIKELQELEITNENAVIQFIVTTALQGKIEYRSTTVSGDFNYSIKHFNSKVDKTTTKILKVWGNAIHSRGIFKDGKVNQEKLKALKDHIDALHKFVLKSPVEDLSDIKKRMFQLMNEVGFQGLSPHTLNDYFSIDGLSDKNKRNKIIFLTQKFTQQYNYLLNSLNKKNDFRDGANINAYRYDGAETRLANEWATLQEEYFLNVFDDSVIGPSGMLYSFGLVSHMNEVLSRAKSGDLSYLDMIAEDPYGKNSEIIRIFREARESAIDENNEFNYDIFKNDPNIVNFKLKVINNFKLEKAGDKGSQNKNLTEVDNEIDAVNATLAPVVNKNQSMANKGLNPVDKNTGRVMEGLPFKTFNVVRNLKGDIDVRSTLAINESNIDILFGYFENEYNRIFHYQSIVNKARAKHPELSDEQFNEEILPTIIPVENLRNNYKNFYIFQEFNNTDDLWYSNGDLVELSEDLKTKIRLDLTKWIIDQSDFSFDRWLDIGVTDIFELETSNKKKVPAYRQNVLSNEILDYYVSSEGEIIKKHLNRIEAAEGAVGYSRRKSVEKYYALKAASVDYAFNNIVANIESTIIFNGDPAYYKVKEFENGRFDMGDFFKRASGPYIDGLRLYLSNADEINFTVAAVKPIEHASNYFDQIAASMDDAKLVKGEDGIERYFSKKASGYANVNRTDGQGWITPKRWKFLMQKLGKWSDIHESAFNKITVPVNGVWRTLDQTELNVITAQPLKGVYFGKSRVVKGMPPHTVYLKYSQAVLMPQFTKGLPLDDLRKKMENESVDEMITLDGIKIGAVNPISIANDKGNVKIDGNVPFAKMNLDNRNWRLQQDLPTKGFKERDIGSQIKKNILINLGYIKNDIEGVSGKQFANEIIELTNLIEKLSKEEFLSQFQNEFGEIDTEKLKKFYEKELSDISYGMKQAIAMNMSLSSIPGHRRQIQQKVMAAIEDGVAKIKSNGMGAIQIADFGINRLSEGEQSRIKWLNSSGKPVELTPPRVIDGKFHKGKALISGSVLKKYLPDYQNMTFDQIMKKIDKRILSNVIGYRIPNQNMASNDALEIVGILPPELGDSVIAYPEITTKTGSDFDIDKMYLMLPYFEADPDTGFLVYSTGNNRKGKTNKLIEKYNSVLTHPDMYSDIMQPIDGKSLSDYIKNPKSKFRQALVNSGIVKENEQYYYMNPSYQSIMKFRLASGKAGVGFVANNVVSHPLFQITNTDSSYVLYNGHVLKDKKDNVVGTSFSQEYDKPFGTREKIKISTVLSWYLNAFVDIGKDDYIGLANYTAATNNVAFFLIRGGVSYEWVTSFVSNKALRNTKQTDRELGKTRMQDWLKDWVNDYKINPHMSVSDLIKYKKADEKEPFLEEIDRKLMSEMTLKGKDIGTAFSSVSVDTLNAIMAAPTNMTKRIVANAFREYRTQAAELSKDIKMHKVGTEGLGTTIAEKDAIVHLFNNIDSGTIGYENPINYFVTKNIDIKNKVKLDGYGSLFWNLMDAASSITDKMFIEETRGFKKAAMTLMQATRQSDKIDFNTDFSPQNMQEIYDFLYYWYASRFDGSYNPDERFKISFKMDTKEDYNETFREINELHAHAQEKLGKNNFMLSLLETFDTKNGYTIYGISQTQELKGYAHKNFILSWEELLYSNDPKINRFAKLLIKNGIHSSQFKKNFNSINQYIPPRYLNEAGFDTHMRETTKKLAQGATLLEGSENYEYTQHAVEAYVRNNLEKIKVSGGKTYAAYNSDQIKYTKYRITNQPRSFYAQKNEELNSEDPNAESKKTVFANRFILKSGTGKEFYVSIPVKPKGYDEQGRYIFELTSVKEGSAFDKKNDIDFGDDLLEDLRKNVTFILEEIKNKKGDEIVVEHAIESIERNDNYNSDDITYGQHIKPYNYWVNEYNPNNSVIEVKDVTDIVSIEEINEQKENENLC